MRPVVVANPETGEVVRSKVLRRTPCGKQGYSSRKIAAGRAAIVRRDHGEAVHHYHCRDCHCWHIGHPPGSRSAA